MTLRKSVLFDFRRRNNNRGIDEVVRIPFRIVFALYAPDRTHDHARFQAFVRSQNRYRIYVPRFAERLEFDFILRQAAKFIHGFRSWVSGPLERLRTRNGIHLMEGKSQRYGLAFLDRPLWFQGPNQDCAGAQECVILQFVHAPPLGDDAKFHILVLLSRNHGRRPRISTETGDCTVRKPSSKVAMTSAFARSARATWIAS